MSVDSDGTTRWRGVLSGANPIARVVWNMLKEGMVHLGVSVGGKINGVRPGRDAIGRTCNLITDVRLDELSITDNPANRLIESETPDNGAYITALAKSVGNTMLAQKQQHYIYLNGIAYTAHPSEEHGIVLRKAGRRRAPSPGQLGLFGGHNEGDTKVEDGVTYRLNSNSRWERMDKPKASGKPSGGKKKAEKPAIVPVVEDEPAAQDPEPTVGEMLEQQQAAIADEPMPEGEPAGGDDAPSPYHAAMPEAEPAAAEDEPAGGDDGANIASLDESKERRSKSQQHRGKAAQMARSILQYFEGGERTRIINEAGGIPRSPSEGVVRTINFDGNETPALVWFSGDKPAATLINPNGEMFNVSVSTTYGNKYKKLNIKPIRFDNDLARKISDRPMAMPEAEPAAAAEEEGEGGRQIPMKETITGMRGQTPASYIIRDADGNVIREVPNTRKNRDLLRKVKPEFKIQTIGEYLASLNQSDIPMPEGEAMEGADDGAMPEDDAIATPASLKALVASLDLRRGDGTKIPDALNKKLKSRLNQVISTAVKMDAVPEREFVEKINKKIDNVYRLFEKEVAGEIWQNNDGAYQRPFNKVFGAIIDWAKGVRMQESDQNHTDMLDAQLAEATRLAREERLGLHLSGPDRALYRFNAEIKRDQALRRIDEEVAQRNQLNKTGTPMTIDNFLRKALGNPGREFGSGSWRDTGIPAMGRKVDAKSPQPKGGKKVQMDESGSAHAGKGIGGKQPKAHRPYSSGGMPPTDVFGITITQLTRNLAKACYMDKDAWGSPETVSFLTDSARAIAGMTDTPTDPMVNFVRFLQYCTRFAQELPFMNDYQAAGTVKAMNADLTKALDEFVEKMPEELKGKPLRPAGSPGVVGIDVQFPQQYVIYS
jgi:hypothetical protein